MNPHQIPIPSLDPMPIARVKGYHGDKCVVEPLVPGNWLPEGMALYSMPFPVSTQGKGRGRNKGLTDAVRLLNVGESVLLPVSIAHAAVIMNRVSKSNGRAYTSKTEKTGVRIWRIEP